MSDTMKSIGELLGQDKIWVHRDGRTLIETDLNEMDLNHIKSLRAWLLRQADAIMYGVRGEVERALRVHGASEMAGLDLENELTRMDEDPETWMRGTVLFEALTGRLENVAVELLTRTDLATIMHLVKTALSSPPGTHTEHRLRDIERLRRKLDGTGGEIEPVNNNRTRTRRS